MRQGHDLTSAPIAAVALAWGGMYIDKKSHDVHDYEDNYTYYYAMCITTLIESHKYKLIHNLIII